MLDRQSVLRAGSFPGVFPAVFRAALFSTKRPLVTAGDLPFAVNRILFLSTCKLKPGETPADNEMPRVHNNTEALKAEKVDGKK